MESNQQDLDISWYPQILPALSWGDDLPLLQHHYSVRRQNQPAIEVGYVDVIVDENGTGDISYVRTIPGEERRGVGSTALRAALAHLKLTGISAVETQCFSVPGLHTFGSVIPHEAIQFIDYDEHDRPALPLRFEQALLSAQRSETEPTNNIVEFVGFGARVALADIDTSDWQLPTISLHKPQEL